MHYVSRNISLCCEVIRAKILYTIDSLSGRQPPTIFYVIIINSCAKLRDDPYLKFSFNWQQKNTPTYCAIPLLALHVIIFCILIV